MTSHSTKLNNYFLLQVQQIIRASTYRPKAWPFDSFDGSVSAFFCVEAKITELHRRDLERQALDLAVRDAKPNFKAATRSCGLTFWKITSIRESDHPALGSIRPLYQRRVMASAGAMPGS